LLAVVAKLRELNPNSAQFHTANAWMELDRWRFDDAIAEAHRATQLDPKFARAHTLYGHLMLLLRGDVETARREFEIAASSRDPFLASPLPSTEPFLFERKFTNVMAWLMKEQTIEPRSPGSHYDLGQAYEALQKYEKAIDEYEAGDRLSSDDAAKTQATFQTQRSALTERGPRGWWQTRLDQMRQSPSPDLYEMSKLQARLGNKKAAFELLEQAYRQHNGSIVWLLVDDAWDPFHKDPHFIAMVKKLGLANLPEKPIMTLKR
jgi:tetratricopeptide (TPR) repeat protein